MDRIIGITGTPGTGKKSVSKLVAKELGLMLVGLNEFSASHGLVGPSGSVDVKRLKHLLDEERTANVLLFGHLLPYVVDPGSVVGVYVLRCEPSALKRRLESRGYDRDKLVDNLEAELIGLLAAESFGRFGGRKTFEVDTTMTTPREAAERIVTLSKGIEGRGERIDWSLSYDSGLKLRSLLSADRPSPGLT